MPPPRDNFNGLNYEEHAPGSGMKGGGFRGGPKRWTGTGPKPARHIPWPEIFRHHISSLEGHEKMIDMIRKHTVEGTENWKTINAMLKRSGEMVQMAKRAAADFIPPSDHLDQVPIGSSSASMYPGYSPADHVYGEAAAEFGRHASKTQTESKLEMNPRVEGPEYGRGQSHTAKTSATRESIVEFNANATPLGTRNSAKRGANAKDDAEPDGAKSISDATKTAPEHHEPNPYFVIDTNPTPVQQMLPERGGVPKKNEDTQATDPGPDGTEGTSAGKKQNKNKKRKRADDVAMTGGPEEQETVQQTEADESRVTKKKKKGKGKKGRKQEALENDAANGDNPSAEPGKNQGKRKNKKATEPQENGIAENGGDQSAEPAKKKGKKGKKAKNANQE